MTWVSGGGSLAKDLECYKTGKGHGKGKRGYKHGEVKGEEGQP